MARPVAQPKLLTGLLPLLALSLAGWGLILWALANMSAPLVALTMPMQASWTLAETLAVAVMWTVMMGAMMLPSAIPLVLAHLRLTASHTPRGATPGLGFLTGYLLAWTLFSLAATALQWGFQRAETLSFMLKLQDTSFAAALLILAGAYQLTHAKARSLGQCRAPSPASGLGREHRGVIRLGFDEGLCCIGCCWALMLLLFVGGVMNLATIAALTLAVAVEKCAPYGLLLARLSSLPLIAWGLWLAVGA